MRLPLRRRLAPLLLAAAAVPAAVVVAPPASAATGACLPGTSSPTCTFWTGKVTTVHDGDTMSVDVYGDGTSTPVKLRLTGIQAMEQTVYSRYPSRRRGECHSLVATARLEALVKAGGYVVRLAAQDPRSQTGGRLRRQVSVKINGSWRDTGEILVREGHALWLPNSVEYAWNNSYRMLSQRAAANRWRLWDTDYCGYGPNQASRIKLWVNWDAEGSDGSNVNGEWVRLRNYNATTDVNLAGWWLRDSFLRRYTFPAGAVLRAGGTVTVHMGSGTNSATRFYWGLSSPPFENVTRDARGMGDGAYLFDPQGDLRYWMSYACSYACNDPLAGKVDVSANPFGTEYVQVRNISAAPVDLQGHLIVNHPYNYPFTAPTVLGPGETLRLYVRTGKDTPLTRYWNKSSNILNDDGDVVSVRTFDDQVSDCYDWGKLSC